MLWLKQWEIKWYELSQFRFFTKMTGGGVYMNMDVTYQTRRQRVRGAVNGFIWHRGFTGEKHFSEELLSGSQEKLGFELIFWKSAKIDSKNLPTKIAMLTLKIYCDSHVWTFSNLKRVFAVENKFNLLVILNIQSVNVT